MSFCTQLNVCTSRLYLNYGITSDFKNWPFRIYDLNSSNDRFSLVANTIFNQILYGIKTRNFIVHRAISYQARCQVTVKIVFSLHPWIVKFITRLRNQFCITDQLNYRRNIVLDNYRPNDLQCRIALRIFDIIRHLVSSRLENIYWIRNNDAASQVPVHAIFSLSPRVDIVYTTFHYDG